MKFALNDEICHIMVGNIVGKGENADFQRFVLRLTVKRTTI